jgi:hypothetical protein
VGLCFKGVQSEAPAKALPSQYYNLDCVLSLKTTLQSLNKNFVDFLALFCSELAISIHLKKSKTDSDEAFRCAQVVSRMDKNTG